MCVFSSLIYMIRSVLNYFGYFFFLIKIAKTKFHPFFSDKHTLFSS